MRSPNIVKTVISLYYPETRAIVDELWAEKPHELYERAYEGRQENFHVPYLEAWKDWSGVDVRAFPHAYATGGASEPIKDIILLAPISSRLHVFRGEYEGYARIAEGRQMPVIRHESPEELLGGHLRPDDLIFLSDPSAIDGEFEPGLEGFLSDLERRDPRVKVVVDMAYVGACSRHTPIDPSAHPNVHAVLFSLSKPFGVYGHRIGGAFCRQEIPTLVGTKWFKNYFSLQLGLRLMESSLDAEGLPNRYAAHQQAAINHLKVIGELPASAVQANVVLLARGTDGPEDFMRAPGRYRFCLTPALDRKLNPEGGTR
jgi:histidinol-phosphate/aromatic aminotransferase/cobyric acid decarboxylase-like protein